LLIYYIISCTNNRDKIILEYLENLETNKIFLIAYFFTISSNCFKFINEFNCLQASIVNESLELIYFAN